MKRSLLILAAGAVLAATSVPAFAGTVVYNGTTYNPGDSINVSFVGVTYPGGSGNLTLTFTGTSGNDYDFTYSLLNTSTDPSTSISGFGFDVTGATVDLATSSSTGTYTNVNSGSISGGVKVDFCASAGPTCPGGSNGGPTPGGTASGSLVLEFTSAADTFTLTDPVIRMQNAGPNGNGSDIGDPVPGVPEPASWAMLLLGFGGIGAAMRRSRRRTALMQVA